LSAFSSCGHEAAPAFGSHGRVEDGRGSLGLAALVDAAWESS